LEAHGVVTAYIDQLILALLGKAGIVDHLVATNIIPIALHLSIHNMLYLLTIITGTVMWRNRQMVELLSQQQHQLIADWFLHPYQHLEAFNTNYTPFSTIYPIINVALLEVLCILVIMAKVGIQ
jgi:hypothetical protein